MDGVVEELKRRRDAGDRERRQQERHAAGCERVAALCAEVAGWTPASVVEPGWRAADADDAVVQLAWAVRDLHAAMAACGLIGRLEELTAGAADPAAVYAWGLLRLAGGEGKRLELEDRVRDAWADPSVWREVAVWFRRLPTLLPTSAAVPDAGIQTGRDDRDGPGDGVAEAPRAVESPYLTAEEAAAYLRTTVQGLYSMRKRGLVHPLPGRPGSLLFTREALDRSMQTRRRGR